MQWAGCRQVHGAGWATSDSTEGTHQYLRETVFYRFWKAVVVGEAPDGWEKENVIHHFKKGKKDNLSNYRPISLTSNPCKITKKASSKLFPGTRWTRRWFGTASMYLSTANHAWLTWLPSLIRLLPWWMEKEQWMSFCLTSARLSA